MRSTTLGLSVDTTRLFEPDTLIPDQFYATLKRSQIGDPELRLMAAILEDAVSCLSKDHTDAARHHQKSAEDAEYWINTEGEDDWIFSFTNVCESLGLDPNYMRSGLRRWTLEHRDTTSEPLRLKKYRSGPRRRKMRFRAAM
jgi:hypothetical protein